MFYFETTCEATGGLNATLLFAKFPFWEFPFWEHCHPVSAKKKVYCGWHTGAFARCFRL